MTVNRTAYDTTACNSYAMKKTVDALEKAAVSGWLHSLPDTEIYVVENDNDGVVAFAHPVLFNNANKEPMLALDVRSFGKWDGAQANFVVRNSTEYKLATHRAKLNYIWINHSPTLLRDISKLPLAVYASWISEAISKRFALDPQEQMNLAILSAIFYSSLFHNDEVLNEQPKLRAVGSISQALRVEAKAVLAILDRVSVIPNATSFCTWMQEITGSVRLSEMNVGLLYGIIGSSWYGTNPKENLAVALEHPPTWLAILTAAFSERSFKDSAITKITERNGNKDIGKDYVRAILNLDPNAY